MASSLPRPVLPPAASSSNLLSPSGHGYNGIESIGDSTGLVMAEVPLLHHCSAAGGAAAPRRPRFRVDDAVGSVSLVLPEHSGGSVEEAADAATLKGSASASAQTVGGQALLVTTAALAEEPGIVVASILPRSSGGAGSVLPTSLEVDLSGCSEFDHPVGIGCFLESASGGGADDADDEDFVMTEEDEIEQGDGRTVLRINMVDAAGAVLSLLFALPASPDHSPEPLSEGAVTFLSIPGAASDRLYLTPGSSLTPASVAFLSPTRILVALSPHLLCVDLQRRKVAPWTEAKCLYGPDGRSRRRSSLGKILRSAGSILTGMNPENVGAGEQGDDDDDDTDEGLGGGMAPVAAVCAASTSSGGGRASTVFTLHADGAIRLWSASSPSTSLYPKRCRRIRVPSEDAGSGLDGGPRLPGEDPPLPPPHAWCPSGESVSLSGLVYDDVASNGDGLYALACYVRTADSLGLHASPSFGAGGKGASAANPCRLLLLCGPSDARTVSVASDSALPLYVPGAATALVDAAFSVRPGEGLTLSALFEVVRDLGEVCPSAASGGDGRTATAAALLDRATVRTAAVATYAPSKTGLSLLDRSPRVAFTSLELGRTADDDALAELDALFRSAPAPGPGGSGAGESSASLEDGICALDAEYLKKLLRPPLGPAPSRAAVTRAVRALVPSHSVDESGSRRIEAEALLAVREWRRAEGTRRSGRALFGRRATTNGASSRNRASATRVLGDDVYAAFATPARPRRSPGPVRYNDLEDDSEDENADADAELTESERTARDLAAHRDRWVRLLLAAGDESSALRGPLRLVALPAAGDVVVRTEGSDAFAAPEDATVLIRGGVTSVLTLSSISNLPSRNASTAAGEEIDALALTLLRRLRRDPERRSYLSRAEDILDTTAATASTAMDRVDGDFLAALSDMGLWALQSPSPSDEAAEAFEETRRGGDVPSIAERCRDALRALSPEDLASYLGVGGAADYAMARIGLGSSDGASLGDGSSFVTPGGDEIRRLAAAAAALSRRCVESTRSLTLARCLLLFGVQRLLRGGHDEGGDSSSALGGNGGSSSSLLREEHLDGALRAHLRACAVQWAGAQAVPAVDGLLGGCRGAAPSPGRPAATQPRSSTPSGKIPPPRAFGHRSPPRSTPRRAAGVEDRGSASSLPRSAGKITLIDAHLLRLAGSPASSPSFRARGGSAALSASAVAVARSYLRAAFAAGDPLGALPPLAGATPSSSSSSAPRYDQYPRIALRLLAPFVSHPPGNINSAGDDDDDGGNGRRPPNSVLLRRRWRAVLESAAECLLCEASASERGGSQPPEKVAGMREKASALLLDACDRGGIAWEDDASAWSEPRPRPQPQPCDLTVAFEVLAAGPPPDGGGMFGGPIGAAASAEGAEAALSEMLSRLLSPASESSPTPGSSSGDEHDVDPIDEDVLRLRALPAFRALFLPWATAAASTGDPSHADEDSLVRFVLGHFPDDPRDLPARAQIEFLVRALLGASDLMHRVSVLERHVGPSSPSSSTGAAKGRSPSASSQASVLVSAVGDVLSHMEATLPRSMCLDRMPEYAALWSSSFRHALWGRLWDEARTAALANPLSERRVANFKRLVIGAADAGAFGALLRQTLVVVGGGSGERAPADNGDAMDVDVDDDAADSGEPGPSGEIDLYELAAETLAEAADDQSRGGGGRANYCGCLYALHGSRGRWRRAAQAMDYYGLSAAAGFATTSSVDADAAQPPPSPDDAARAMAAIALSHLGAAHAVRLEPAPAHRFVVSGELSSHPVPPFFRGLAAASLVSTHRRGSKRGREGDKNAAIGLGDDGQGSGADVSSEAEDRSVRLMTEEDLKSRAVRTLALRTLHADAAGPSKESIGDLLRLSDRDVVTALSRLGYYDHALAVSKNMARKRRGRRPAGRDVLSDAVSYVACSFLCPAAVALSRPDPEASQDGSVIHRAPARPTLAQLRQSMGSSTSSAAMGNGKPQEPLSCRSFKCEAWRSSAQSAAASRGALAMDLLQWHTASYSGPHNALALEVAGTLLDLDRGRTELPPWATDLLTGRRRGGDCGPVNDEDIGVVVDDTAAAPGLFAAARGGAAGANPAGLVRLYMSRGMYAQACDVVASVLSSADDGRHGGGDAAATTSRLPERGGVDFVPHNLVDMLWDVIEAAVVASPAGRRGGGERRRLLAARTGMERALERHFRAMRVSEMGMRSARVLNNS